MIKGLNVGEYAVIINGRQIDVAYGDQWKALEQEGDWRQALQDEQVADNLDRSFDDLYEDDTYWKNGHVEPLRLEEEDEPIPFQGEPVHAGQGWGGAPERYGLEARG